MWIIKFVVKIASEVQNKIKLFKQFFWENVIVFIVSVIFIYQDLHPTELNWHNVRNFTMSIPIYFVVIYGAMWVLMLMIVFSFDKLNRFPCLVQELRYSLDDYRLNFNQIYQAIVHGKLRLIYPFYLLYLLQINFSWFNFTVCVFWAVVYFGIPSVVRYTINNIQLTLQR
jgi:hypothetical protein